MKFKKAKKILNDKIANAAQSKNEETETKKTKKEKSFFDSSAVKQVERTAASVITRNLLGILGKMFKK